MFKTVIGIFSPLENAKTPLANLLENNTFAKYFWRSQVVTKKYLTSTLWKDDLHKVKKGS